MTDGRTSQQVTRSHKLGHEKGTITVLKISKQGYLGVNEVRADGFGQGAGSGCFLDS